MNMAAPPIPPKGSSDSWVRGSVKVDPHLWRADGQSLFTDAPQPNTGFNDNFTPSPLYENFGQNAQAPPLPPRPSPEAFQRTSRSTFVSSELNLVPPPPGSGQLYKNPSFNTSSSTSSSIVTNSVGQNSLLRSSMMSNNSGTMFVGHFGSSIQHNRSSFSSASGYPLAFTNNMYQSQYREFAHTEVQHSKSAPNIANCTVPTRNFGNCFVPPQNFTQNVANCAVPVPRLTMPNENSTINKTSYAIINHGAKFSNNNSHANLEDIYKFMKKRSDSNLIDLYCSDNDLKLNGTQANKCNDDILRLFDPLATSSTVNKIENEIVNLETESKLITTKTITNQVNNDSFNKTGTIDEETKHSTDSTIASKPHIVTREATVDTVPKEICATRESSTNQSNGKIESILKIIHKNENGNKEFDSFCTKLKKLRLEFSYDDHVTNTGLVISSTLDSYQENSLSIKLIINSINSERPVSFTCDVNTSVEHIISHTVCSIFDNASTLCMDNFVLKVYGLSEYFTSHSTLADYDYVHQCHKFDKPVCLTLTDIKDLKRPLARTKNDDINDSNFKHSDIAPSSRKGMISYESLKIILETLEKETEKLKSSALKFETLDSLKPQGVVQAVKAICTLLSHVETTEVTDTVAAFIQVCLLYDKLDENGFDTLPELGNLGKVSDKKSESDLLNLFQLLELSLSHLQHAVHELLAMYAKAFRVNFEVESFDVLQEDKRVTDFLDTPLFEVGIVHRLDPSVTSTYEAYFLVCEIHHGGSLLTSVTSKMSTVSKSFFPRIVFEEWLEFQNISMCTLPKESVLYFTMWGNNTNQSDNKQSNNNTGNKACIGWCGIRLFSYEGELAQGSFLLGFWPPDILKNSGPLLSNPDSTCSLLHVRLPDFGCTVKFPSVIDNQFVSSQMRSFESLESHLQSVLKEIIEKDTLKSLLTDEKEWLWEKKYYLHQFPNALPKVLLSAHGWDWACLSDIYSLLKAWTPLSPVESLYLLMPCFPNLEVRKTAITWMKDIVSDELCDYLPQIVQILRYEAWDDSPTAWFLLERSLTSVRVAHHLYWLLKQNINDPIAGDRMRLMLNSLLTITGEAMRKRIKTQESLLEDLSSIADTIKSTKESLRLSILFHKLEQTHHNLLESPTCLPLSPSLEVCGVDVKSCSYFTSNTLPLRLVFHTPEMMGKNNEAIFKVGDDLRQDMITIQMIRIMDKLWLKGGLDLKIVTFTCVATEVRKGMVELVPGAETLRKIQTELGLTGSFKDRPIAEWLQKYNTSELEYQQAVENFTLSCAGYCVATYILGICDRHNDNIMLKPSGHIFHIDFGKFLGDSQMFGNIKRDRTPFVLTSDMAYVINGGDKPSKKFQYFIDLCCQAFNIVRSHKNIFFNLFSLLISSGIPGMSSSAVSYIEKALLPNMSEAEATVHFTHMIQESLKSWFTQFNFFIHNLAQLRFTGDHNDGLMLSFTSKTYTKDSDGKIVGADIIGYRKMYDPEKYYIYVIEIKRENFPDPLCVFRTYREFIEFHQKLCMLFPLAKFHPLPGNPLMGRTNVREVADKRKAELSLFLRSLMGMAEEIAHCNLVYSFFHPLLRDQEGMAQEKEAKCLATSSRRSSSLTEIHGQIKLSTVYKNDSLFIMVMHAKNLSSPKGTAPDPYIKTYLLPDSNKTTKRKTKIVSKNSHPTFMEMIVYNLPLDVVRHKALHVSVWDYDRVQENEFLGAVLIPLTHDLSRETTQWYPLGQFNN